MLASWTSLNFLSKRYVAAAVLSLFTLWIIMSDSRLDLESLRYHVSDLTTGGKTDDSSPQDDFVQEALRNEIYVTEYNGTAVRKLCREAEWRDDRVTSCDKIAGGIGNLKSSLLACTRYAIEAGAVLVSPVIHPREGFEKMEDSFGWNTNLPLSYMFDSDHYFTTLAEDCPQLRIVGENDSVHNIRVPPRSEAHVVNPKKLIPADLGHVLIEPANWRPALDKYIEEEVIQENKLPEPSRDNPIRISFDDNIIFSWPVAYDGSDFRSSWGHLAPFPRYIREISARALYNLYQKIGVQQSPSAPSTGAFLGAHIRTEQDAKVYDWTSYETQSRHVREQLVLQNLSVVYVATGTPSDVDRLRDDVAGMQIPVNDTHTTAVQVFHKWDVLEEADTMVMNNLTWDQMALVDLDIMLRSSRFVGIWESSWSWSISLKRHAWSDADPYDYHAHPLTYEDGLSIIHGPIKAQPIIDPCFWL